MMDDIDAEFSHEDIASTVEYPSSYQLKGVVAQINILRELFPELGHANEDLLAQIRFGDDELPAGAEGWFAIPHWPKVASTYQEAVEKVMGALEKIYGGRFINDYERQLGSRYLRETPAKFFAFETLQRQQSQSASILLVPAQFGIRHRGRSVKRVREVVDDGEFGLGTFEVGIMLLTHPDRLQHKKNLSIEAMGDECSDCYGEHFNCAPYFGFFFGHLRFGSSWISDTNGMYGAATGFAVNPAY